MHMLLLLSIIHQRRRISDFYEERDSNISQKCCRQIFFLSFQERFAFTANSGILVVEDAPFIHQLSKRERTEICSQFNCAIMERHTFHLSY